MKQFIKIRLTTNNSLKTLNNLIFMKIYYIINKENKNYLDLTINKTNLKKVKSFYKVKVIRDYSITSIISIIKNNYLKISAALICVILFALIINTIVEVNITCESSSLKQDLIKSLEHHNIKRLTFKKNFSELATIKEELMNEYHNEIEWIEIKNFGMKYFITLEERKKKNVIKDPTYCNVIAKTDGIITKIYAQKGVIMLKENTYVRQGQEIISGNIIFNEEQKSTTCAKGMVYAEKWYQVKLSIPKIYKEKKLTNKKRYNLLFENNNLDFKIFKSRLENYDTTKKQIISLFNKKLYLLIEQSYDYIEKTYTNDELNLQIEKLISEKVNLSLKDDEKILYKNVLKKDENDSKIEIEVFVTVEKLISEQQVIENQ